MTYRIIMKTPLGKKSGHLTICESDNVLKGYIDILGHRTVIQDSKLVDGQCRFSGEFVTPVRNITFSAQGTADSEHVLLDVKAGLLDLSISGEAETDHS